MPHMRTHVMPPEPPRRPTSWLHGAYQVLITMRCDGCATAGRALIGGISDRATSRLTSTSGRCCRSATHIAIGKSQAVFSCSLRRPASGICSLLGLISRAATCSGSYVQTPDHSDKLAIAPDVPPHMLVGVNVVRVYTRCALNRWASDRQRDVAPQASPIHARAFPTRARCNPRGSSSVAAHARRHHAVQHSRI